MSYILEAIRKSDQMRRRGAAPTLPSAPFASVPEESKARWFYPALGILLIAAAFAIGWMRPWQSEPEPKAPDAVTRAPPRLAPIPARPVAVPPASHVAAAAPKAPEKAAAPVTSAQPPSVPPPPPQSDKIVPYAELPPQIRGELPPMRISVHAYSRTPRDRLVDVNDKLLHEGDVLGPGLVLEAITPEGMVFNYKGTRFSRGVQ